MGGSFAQLLAATVVSLVGVSKRVTNSRSNGYVILYGIAYDVSLLRGLAATEQTGEPACSKQSCKVVRLHFAPGYLRRCAAHQMKLSPWPIYSIEPSAKPIDICRIHPNCKSVQLPGIPSDNTLKVLAKRLARRPDVALRFYSWDTEPADIEFLKWFPTLQAFYLDSAVTDLNGLQYLPASLVSLRIGGEYGPRLDLAPLQRFKELRSLSIARHTKNIASIACCKRIRDLQLWNLSLPDLTLLRGMKALRALDINLGGTRSLAGLEDCNSLRYLAICQVRNLVDISLAAKPNKLQYLELRSLRNVTQLPEMGSMHELRYLSLWKMPGIADLQQLVECPTLRELSLIDMSHLETAALAPLVEHPTLKMLRCGLGSKRKNKAGGELVGLPWTGHMTDALKLRARLAGHAA